MINTPTEGLLTQAHLRRPGLVKSGLCGTGPGWRLVILMVSGFVLGWAHTAQRGVEAAVVPPVNPLQSGQLDLLDAAPGSAAFDQLGLEQPIDCLGECVIKAVPAAADRADDAELGEPVGVAHRQILTAPVAVVNQLIEAAHSCPRGGPMQPVAGPRSAWWRRWPSRRSSVSRRRRRTRRSRTRPRCARMSGRPPTAGSAPAR